MLPSIPRLREHDVSPYTGFLPGELPLEVLPDPYYAPWETVGKNLNALLLSRRLRGVVDRLPVLSTDYLRTSAELRRAYSLLAFITHAYIWGGDRPAEVVPPPVSIPFLVLCRELELPPVATYAAVALWNFKPVFEDEPIDNLENLSTIHTLTGSLDESWFYLVSVAIEARGAPIIPLMLDAIHAARNNDTARVIQDLQSFAERLDELGTLLLRMYENCDPNYFYNHIRTYLAGSKNMADAGLPNGVIFDDGTGTSKYVQYSGGSNAQSSLIQFFDLVLGIEHRPTGSTKDDPTSSNPADSTNAPSHSFILDMRKYMPGPHARFLERVAEVANIREYVEQRPHEKALSTSYDACLAMLRALRDKHIQIVSRYIILQSRQSRSSSRPGNEPEKPGNGKKLDLARASNAASANGREKKSLKGTGGTALIPFLKQARDETGEPAIGSWARRILTDRAHNSNSAGFGAAGAALGGVDERKSGQVNIVGLAGVWSADDSEGGICHW